MIRMVRNVPIPPDVTTNVLRRGDKGAAVAVLQDLLKAYGFTATGPTDGDFGDRTWAAVLTFQQACNLTVDGAVGPNTWLMLTSPPPVPGMGPIHPLGNARAQEVLGVAIGELGEVEVPDGSNRGPRVDVYTGKWPVPWCALFVDWCLGQCPWDPWRGPRLSAVVKVRDWALEHELYERTTSYVPEPGDLFVLLEPGQPGVDPSYGHVGFVLAYDVRAKMYRTVEGNSSNGVRSNIRKRSAVNGFVRIAA